jgi:hypothetical protein
VLASQFVREVHELCSDGPKCDFLVAVGGCVDHFKLTEIELPVALFQHSLHAPLLLLPQDALLMEEFRTTLAVQVTLFLQLCSQNS